MKYYRPAWAEINLSNLEFNFRQIKKIVSKKTKIMAVVKCDAYGHGLLPIAKRLTRLNVDYLGVASIDEAVVLRNNRLKLPILVLGSILNKDVEPVFKYDLIQTVSDYDLALRLNQRAKRAGRVIRVHIKVDTGMGRLGVLFTKAAAFIREVSGLSNLKIEGLFTHFPCADSDPEFTNYQIKIFNQLNLDLMRIGVKIPLCHSANSMGVMGYSQSHFNLVRPGLMLYGIHPKSGLDIKLKPVLSLKSRIVYLKRMPAGQGISYGRCYITKKETTVATLSVGYGDGYPRNLSNRGDVLMNGKRFRISGAVCMDQIMLDVGEERLKTGDEAVLIGSQKNLRISVEELAELAVTIPYEIVCGIGSRIPRIYSN